MKAIKSIQHITLTGSPYAVGRGHGEQGKKEIHRSLETYEALFKGYTGMKWKEVREKAMTHHDAIAAFRPAYLEEMQGIADAAGVQFEDILTLNARSEIALTSTPDGCTSFAIQRGANTWLGQNWDWKGSQIDALLDVHIELEGKPNIRMITEGGIIGKIGMNAAGIGVCLNALLTRTWQPKIPLHLSLRAVLESHSFEEAVAVVNGNVASPAHFLIASREGGMAGMEVSPIRTAMIEPVDGMVVHTNHICQTQLQEVVADFPIDDSVPRLQRMQTLLREMKEDVEQENLFHILADHHGYPDSICRHVNERNPAHTQMETVFSIVMCLTEGTFEYKVGHPCHAGVL
ncbi:C45 family autoproteolytic acyltransferase/hydrolase [Sporosarcina saromensis]|uniref:C45 family autoproteolytic acyltransferase/hydrolase n=1 Tax=Sporosarcina saromensis TaxID=359365 RepID=A0ABU4G805_9BACL|nr:C45 family peptidase [Sporosarcina saromensis]MDW0113109.1 C45 family autoproteolytic acyltransferase/hydrolase [Sporosarcina saromensis]